MRRKYRTRFKERRVDALYGGLVGAVLRNDPAPVDAVLNRDAYINTIDQGGGSPLDGAVCCAPPVAVVDGIQQERGPCDGL